MPEQREDPTTVQAIAAYIKRLGQHGYQHNDEQIAQMSDDNVSKLARRVHSGTRVSLLRGRGSRLELEKVRDGRLVVSSPGAQVYFDDAPQATKKVGQPYRWRIPLAQLQEYFLTTVA
jgi:hypothetical protein